MLKEITIENFKCFGHKVTIPLGPLTLIYGENSAGKSAILQALRLVRNSVVQPQKGKTAVFSHRILEESDQSSQDNESDNVPYEAVVTDGDKSREIEICMSAVQDGEDVEGCRFTYTAAEDSGEGCLTRVISASEDILLRLDPRRGFTNSKVIVKASVLLDYHDYVKQHYDFLHKHRSEVVEGYRRFFELSVMQDYCMNHSNVEMLIEQVVGRGLEMSNVEHKEYHHSPIIRTMFFKPEKLNKSERFLNGLEEWVVMGIPNWIDVRQSDEYKKRIADYEKEYAADIKYFESDFSLNEHAKRYENDQIILDDQISRATNVLPLQRDIGSMPAIVRDLLLARDINIVPDIDVNELYGTQGVPCLRGSHCFTFRATLPDPSQSIHRQVMTSYDDEEPLLSELAMLEPDFCPIRYEDYRNRLIQSIKYVLMLSKMKVLPPVRKPPSDKYDPNSDFGQLAKIKQRARVNKWLSNIGVNYKIECEDADSEDGKVVYLSDELRSEGHYVKISEAGYGFSQMLPIVLACLFGENELIMIEEPELHIHPGQQANLGGLFVDTFKNRNTQLLIETHSEHLMLRMQRLIRRKELKPEDVVVLYVSRLEDGSNVQRLRLNKEGSFLDPWPTGFFPERLKEVFGD